MGAQRWLNHPSLLERELNVRALRRGEGEVIESISQVTQHRQHYKESGEVRLSPDLHSRFSIAQRPAYASLLQALYVLCSMLQDGAPGFASLFNTVLRAHTLAWEAGQGLQCARPCV